MFCTKCGIELEDGVNFCPNCGQPVKIQPESAVDTVSGGGKDTPAESLTGAMGAAAGTENVTAQYAQHISERKATQSGETGNQTVPDGQNESTEEHSEYSGEYDAHNTQQTADGQWNQRQSGVQNGQFSQEQSDTSEGHPDPGSNNKNKGSNGGQYTDAPQPKTRINTIGQVFCIIALILMFFQAFHVIGAFFGILMSISAEGFMGFLYGVINFGVNVFKMCGIAASAIVMYLIWKKWDDSKVEALMVGTAAGGIVILASVILRMIFVSFFNFIFGYSYASIWSGAFLSIVFVIAMWVMTYIYTSEKQLDAFGELKKGSFTDNIKKDFKTVSDMAVQARDEYKAGKNRVGAQHGNTTAGQNGMNQAASTVNGYPNGGVAVPLETDRSIVAYILLGLITCSIYDLYMLSCMIQDANITCAGDGKHTRGILEFIVFGILTCGIYDYVWLYNFGNRLQENAPRYGMNFQEGGTVIILWYILGAWLCGIGPFIAMYIVIKNSNALNAAYNNMIAQQMNNNQ